MKAIFAHTQTYSRKGNSKSRSVADICAEAARLDGASPHVDSPKPPRIVSGMGPAQLPDLIDARIKQQNRKLRARRKAEPENADGLRGIRIDTHVLVASVYSYPDPVADYDADEYARWVSDVIKFAQDDAARNGLEVMAIIEHMDETHPHIHVHALPIISSANPRMNAKACHEGHVAQDAHIVAGASGSPSRAYKTAMRGWQDRYHQMVGQKHGQARTGPKRRRLSRAAWQAEKQRLGDLQQVAVAKGGLSDARDEFEEQARSMADKLARRERDLQKQEQGIAEGQKRSKQQDVDAKAKASKIIQNARLRERTILAEAENKVEQRENDLKRQASELSRKQQAFEKRANDVRQNAAREAAKIAVEVITGVFLGQSGVSKNGELFVAQPKLADRIKALQIGAVLKDAVQIVSDYWGGLKDRLSPHEVAKERDEAMRLTKAANDAPDDNGGPSL